MSLLAPMRTAAKQCRISAHEMLMKMFSQTAEGRKEIVVLVSPPWSRPRTSCNLGVLKSVLPMSPGPDVGRRKKSGARASRKDDGDEKNNDDGDDGDDELGKE